MAAENEMRVELEKGRLLDDFRRLTQVLEEYHAFVAELNPESEWREEAARLLRTHHAYLARTRTSLRTVELVGALMRRMLGRLHTEAFRFSGQPVPLRTPGDPAAPRGEDLEQLLVILNTALREAPLELQEQLRFVLASSGQLFRALLEQHLESAEEAIMRLNLLTANRQSQHLLHEIAVITRDIYNTLHALSDGLPIDSLTESTGGLGEAVQKLNSVIRRLEESATLSMDNLDALNDSNNQEREALATAGDALRRAQKRLMELKAEHPALEGPLTEVQNQLSDEVGGRVMGLAYQAEQNTDAYIELMSNQGYNELAGQTLKRIIAFMEQLELQLFDLLKTYKPVLELEQPLRATAERRESTEESTQSDVDRLLDELGF